MVLALPASQGASKTSLPSPLELVVIGWPIPIPKTSQPEAGRQGNWEATAAWVTTHFPSVKSRRPPLSTAMPQPSPAQRRLENCALKVKGRNSNLPAPVRLTWSLKEQHANITFLHLSEITSSLMQKHARSVQRIARTSSQRFPYLALCKLLCCRLFSI